MYSINHRCDTDSHTGNITNEATTENGVSSSRSFTYSGTQMTSMSSGGSVQERYFYDGEGNLDCTTTATGTAASCPTSSGGTMASNVVNDYSYDYENRVTNYRGGATSAQGIGSASYSYDALGRQDE